MMPLEEFLRVLSEKELEKLHQSTLDLLSDPGIKIENDTALQTLEKRGAQVDYGHQIVRIPAHLVEKTIEIAAKEEKARFSGGSTTINAPNALTFSWHTPFRERTPEVAVSIGGGCPYYYDHELTLKSLCTALAGEPMFNVGILGAGMVFSPEQLMIDMDIAHAQHAFCRGIGGDQFQESVELIRERGIGGLFIDTDHTAFHFREWLWIPKVFERLKGTDVAGAFERDPVEIAHRKWRGIVGNTELYRLDDERRRAIEALVAKATERLLS